MIRRVTLLILLIPAVLGADDIAWDDPFYALRIPVSVNAPQAGRYALDLDAHIITQWINATDRYGFHPDYFAYDQVKLVEVRKDGTTVPVEAGFQMRLGAELVRNGSFEEHENNAPVGWLARQDMFHLRKHTDGRGSYMATEGADRNACVQNIATDKRRWYHFSARMRGRGSCSPQITRRNEGWQPVDASWADPYFEPDDWRDISYCFYTGDKAEWQTDVVQLRFERFTADVDDISLRACDVKFVININAPGDKRYLLYYAPNEGVIPAPPTKLTRSLPTKTLQVLRTAPAERHDTPIAYRVGEQDDKADIWYAATTHKVGPDDPPPPGAQPHIAIATARNESEALQLVFRPRSGGVMRAVKLQLTGPDGHAIDNQHADIRQARYVPIVKPSMPDYTRTGRSRFVGRLPDPLPRFQPIAYAPGSENLLIWVDVHTPADAPAGVYRGNVELLTDDKTWTIPVELTVWNFTLPDRSTCRTSLQFSRYANQFLFPFHKVESVKDKYELSRRYLAELARYRISAKAPASAAVWNPDGPGHRDDADSARRRYESELPWAFDQLHVNGFALGHVSGPSMPNLTDKDRGAAAAYYEPRAQWLKDRDYLRYSFIQIDEPRPVHFPAMKQWIDAVRSTPIGKEIPMFAFVYNPDCFFDLRDVIDIMVPINNDSASIVSPRAMKLAPDDQQTWFYYTRTAHMWIDAPAIDQRLWAPNVWAFGGSGFAVWGINQWWIDQPTDAHQQYNPWQNPLSTWGNGSLAYFYPPSPLGEQVEQRDMTIVPSLRLLLTRDGIEDYEYGVILTNLTDAARKAGLDTANAQSALASLRRPFTTPHSWAIAEAHWHEARAAAAKAIVDLKRRLHN